MDTMDRRILWHLKHCVNSRTGWYNLKSSMEDEMGVLIDTKYFHQKLEKLRDENKIKFIQVGEFTSYQLV